MSDIAVRVEHLSKQYQLGGQAASYQTFREALITTASAPLRWLKGERRQAEKFWALDDVSFEVKHGEAVGIIGRNGAGKSTLLKILSSITHPTRGRVELYGRVGSLLEVGTGFHPELSGRENIYLNGAILGMSMDEIKRKFDEIVDFSGVEKFLDTPVKFYSSGMYVRLAFAVAAHLEPEILIVDEVLAVGDAEFQKKCLGKMSDVAHGGRTVLFVSHNMGAVKNLCKTCIWLNKGRINEIGKASVVVSNYMNIQSENLNGEVNLPERHDSDAHFFKILIVDDDGLPTHTIPVTSKFTIRLEYQIERKLNDLEVSFSIFDKNFSKIFYSGKSTTFYSPGKYIAEIQIPSKLIAPGQYTITTAIHQPNIQLFDRLESILGFSIVEDSLNYKFLNRDMGAILVNLDWNIHNAK